MKALVKIKSVVVFRKDNLFFQKKWSSYCRFYRNSTCIIIVYKISWNLGSFLFCKSSNSHRLSVWQIYSFFLKPYNTTWFPSWRTANHSSKKEQKVSWEHVQVICHLIEKTWSLTMYLEILAKSLFKKTQALKFLPVSCGLIRRVLLIQCTGILCAGK